MRMHAYGDAGVLRLDEVRAPVPRDGEVLVRVAGTSFNPSEIGLRNGWLRGVFDVSLPYTVGWDLAGTVVGTGEPVVARVDGGAAAGLVAVEAGRLVRAPGGVPLAHAAALPVAGLTAWQAVFEHARVAAGMSVLVNGAGGGIGGFAVQLARHAGAVVTATASPRSEAVVRALGAHEVHDYRLGLPPGPFDVVVNLVPLETPTDLVRHVRPAGTVVSVTTPVAVPPGSDVRSVHFVMRDDTAHLASLVALVDAGVVRLDIAAQRPLADLPAVHRDAEAGLLRGKTVLTP
ncbi:NADP-dependent oxidoreductase [Dactylosporangium sp. NPDC051485]|uniref:NADP-dependent oxidoreductase n=1 Tax=Dactylosporangium sp. NPDC051485 TaxID=3154846 RepID=UPI0034232C67